MGQLAEYIKMALKNIKSNKGRSFLTMLGIIIGISSVIMIISVGNGVSGSVSSDLNEIGNGLIAIYSMDNGDYQAIEFTDDDLTALMEKVPYIKGATGQLSSYINAVGPKGNFQAYVYSGNQYLQYHATEPIIKGAYFTESDVENAAKVCVIRESGAMAMFGTTDVVGKTFEVSQWGQTFELKIVGVQADNSSTLLNMMGSFDQVEFDMPITTFASNFGFYADSFSEIMIYGDGNEHNTEVAQKSMQLLEARHRVTGQGVVLVQSFSDQLSQITGIIDVITIFIVLVAAIALLVGGIGVMNIMLVSVTERTREIGIRKALGARTRSILMQFLFESAIITLLGGIIGIILGSLGAVLVCSLIGFHAKISVTAVIVATLFSSAVGIFFGIYPAKRAAKLSPIEALRHE